MPLDPALKGGASGAHSGELSMKRTDQDLHEILLKNFKEALLFADAQGCIQIFNPVAEKYFGISGKKVLGKKLNNFIKKFDK